MDISNDKIKIKWNIPNDNGGSRITSYDVRRNDGSEFGQNYENEINVDGTIYTFNTLTISTYYSIQS